MDERLLVVEQLIPRATFELQDLETAKGICENMSNKLATGVVKIHDIRSEQYRYMMSLDY
jgi:hypothetical protein